MRNRTVSAAAACLVGCLMAVGPAGCCTHQPCCSRAVAAKSEPAAASDQPVPGALEYPRFHPVPTRPVFLPQGLEPAVAEPQLAPTELQPVPPEPPRLTAMPSDAWRPAGN